MTDALDWRSAFGRHYDALVRSATRLAGPRFGTLKRGDYTPADLVNDAFVLLERRLPNAQRPPTTDEEFITYTRRVLRNHYLDLVRGRTVEQPTRDGVLPEQSDSGNKGPESAWDERYWAMAERDVLQGYDAARRAEVVAALSDQASGSLVEEHHALVEQLLFLWTHGECLGRLPQSTDRSFVECCLRGMSGAAARDKAGYITERGKAPSDARASQLKRRMLLAHARCMGLGDGRINAYSWRQRRAVALEVDRRTRAQCQGADSLSDCACLVPLPDKKRAFVQACLDGQPPSTAMLETGYRPRGRGSSKPAAEFARDYLRQLEVCRALSQYSVGRRLFYELCHEGLEPAEALVASGVGGELGPGPHDAALLLSDLDAAVAQGGAS